MTNIETRYQASLYLARDFGALAGGSGQDSVRDWSTQSSAVEGLLRSVPQIRILEPLDTLHKIRYHAWLIQTRVFSQRFVDQRLIAFRRLTRLLLEVGDDIPIKVNGNPCLRISFDVYFPAGTLPPLQYPFDRESSYHDVPVFNQNLF
jgi:hypothetical protein